MDLQALLNESAESPPCGPDLEYDPAFLALTVAARGKPEQDAAGTLIPAVEPDWPTVRDQAIALLGRSKDLRVAMQLVRALTRTDQLGGFVSGITLVNELLERYWPGVHPLLDAEDNNDPTLRLNALTPIEAPKGSAVEETLLRDLREAAVVPPTKQGKVTVRDLLVLDGKLPATAGVLHEAAVEGLLRAALERDPALAALPSTALDALRRLRSKVAARVGEELAPDVAAAVDMLKPVAQRMARIAGRDAAPEPGEVPAAAAAGPPMAGTIRNRDDVIRAIDLICAYLERTEPANPAPLLLRRAQRLLSKNFVELIADLAPDSVSQVKLIAGLKDE